MRITELDIIEFGGIRNKKIILEDGLNIIYGANESGKSTLTLFIRFMLYGLPPKKGAKSTDRERSLSFGGKRAEGTMTLEHSDTLYRIERRAVAIGAKLNEELVTVNLSTGERYSGEPWQMLFGVPAEIFESSCSISQMRASDINKDKAASAIENMLVSADESIDVKRILSAMDSVRKEYRLNRGEGGLIYETEQNISRLRAKHREALQKHLSYNEMSAKLSRKEKSLEEIDKARKLSADMLEQINGALVLQRFDELDGKKATLKKTQNTLSSLRESEKRGDFIPSAAHVSALKAARFSLNEAEVKRALRERECSALPRLSDEKEALARTGETIREKGGKTQFLASAKDLDKKAASKKSLGLSLIISGAVLVATGVALIAVHLLICVAAAILGAVGICVGIVNVSLSKKAEALRDSQSLELGSPFTALDEYAENCLSALAEKEALCSKSATAKALLTAAAEDENEKRSKLSQLLKMTLDVNYNGEIKAVCQKEEERLGKFCESCDGLSKEIYALGLVISSLETELAPYDRGKLTDTVKLEPASLTQQSIDRARLQERYDKQRYEALNNEVSNLRLALASIKGGLGDDPVELADRICELEAQLASHTEYYEALMLAKEHIESASLSMSGNVTPVISRQASEFLASVSNSAHSSVQTSKNLDLTVEQDGFHISAELLSGGTRDAAYICLRLSLMLRLFGENLPPLIMDESFCQLDDTRASNLLSLLSGLCESTLQCVILTCHSRESSLCEKLGIKSNNISL